MPATQSSDIAFAPKVWKDHIGGHFDTKLGLGRLALMDRTLVAEPGETVNFPYWKTIGAVQEPAETEGLSVDRLADDSFSVTVKEVGKAVGWKDKAIRVSAAGPQRKSAEDEAQRQIGIRMAEKVESDLIGLLASAANYKVGFTATAATHTANVSRLLEMKIKAFGDKQDQTVALAMHSLLFLDVMRDAGTGFLKADANDPFWNAPGFMGRLLGNALFVLDSMPEVTAVETKKTYAAFAFKADPFGIYMAQDMLIERDRDILARENLVAATTWYGVLGLHSKVDALDYRIARGTFATDVASA